MERNRAAGRGRRQGGPGPRRAGLVAAVVTAAAGLVVGGISAVDAATRNSAGAAGTGLSAAFAVPSSWDTGYSAQYTVSNPTGQTRHGWRLEFDLPAGARITSLWEGTAPATSGHVVVTPASWNADLAPGGTVGVGFVVAHARGTAGLPTGCLIDGAACTAAPTPSGTGTPTPSATTPSSPPATGPSTPGTTTPAPRPTTPTPTTPATTPSGTTPPVVAAGRVSPYVDTSLYPPFDLVAATRSTGVSWWNLAFVVSGGGCTPKWGGVTAIGADAVAAQIPKVRAAGGDVRVSFGGAAGSELALVCPDATSLAAAYRQVISAYGLTAVDFDVEGSATADAAANARRGQALAILQREAAAAGRALRVSLTLPVLPSGLTGDGLSVVRATADAGVRIDAVNVMAMDYGDGAAPNPSGKMGAYAIQAATATQKQLVTALGLSAADAWARVAVTPMIGVNDTATEVFTSTDARQLVDFAGTVHLAWLSYWSQGRDQPCAGGPQSWASAVCSGINQQAGDFARAFGRYAG